jgi:sodium-dependent dicarboxylate transporter 2/3/5
MARRLRRSLKRRIPALLGLLAALTLYFWPPGDSLPLAAQRTLAIFIACLVLWVSQLIPLPATGLLALALLAGSGVLPAEEAFSAFGNSAVFFLLGVFLLTAAAIQTGLSKRITLLFLERFDRSPRALLFGVLLTSTSLSLIMPAYGVAAMMFPVVLDIARYLNLRPGKSAFGMALFLALAWGSIIGSVGTFLGGARAPLAVGLLQEAYGTRIGFLEWVAAALPVVLAVFPIAFLVLMIGFRLEIDTVEPARRFLRSELQRIGPMRPGEKRLAALILATILCWILLGHLFNLATIAIVGAVMIFVLRAAPWPELEEYINWGVIVMYGGAIALGRALSETEALQWLVRRLVGEMSVPPLLGLGALAALTMLLTEGISNAATVAVMLPIGFELAHTMNVSPVLIVFAVAIPAGLPFCLPIGSPPNAIAHSANYYSVGDALKRGLPLNLLAITVMLLVIRFYWPLIGLYG